MKHVQSSVMRAAATRINTSAQLAHLLAQVILLPETGFFNAAKLVAMKEDKAEVVVAVTNDASVLAMVMSPSQELITVYEMEGLLLALTMNFLNKQAVTTEQLVHHIAEISSDVEVPYYEVSNAMLTTVAGGDKRQGVSLDTEEYLNGVMGSTIVLRIVVNFPDTYEGKKEDEVSA